MPRLGTVITQAAMIVVKWARRTSLAAGRSPAPDAETSPAIAKL